MRQVLIVGGGASGILVAIHIARHASTPIVVTIAEPSAKLGYGVAYGTSDSEHLLNVPAGRMSALSDEPNHFLLWAGCETGDFVARQRFGRYLFETFLTEQAKNTQVSFVHERVSIEKIHKDEDEFHAYSDSGPIGRFDSVVLALGQGESKSLNSIFNVIQSPLYINDPWRERVPPIDGVLLSIGTGLTFIDHALSHLRRNPSNQVLGISRTGELPKEHLTIRSSPLPVPESVKESPAALRKYIESSDDWRAAQDGVRHELPDIWFRWSDDHKKSFIENDLRWWNVHRHRIAPSVAEEVKQFIEMGRIRILTAQSLRLQSTSDQIEYFVNGRYQGISNLVVNSTGYQSPESLPLLQLMSDDGLIAPGPLGIGFSSNYPSFLLLNSRGMPVAGLFGIGPILIGERFETTAIPEIREQAEQIASALTGNLR